MTNSLSAERYWATEIGLIKKQGFRVGSRWGICWNKLL